MPTLDLNKLKINHIILVANHKPVEDILPADFDNPELFEEAGDIWFA